MPIFVAQIFAVPSRKLKPQLSKPFVSQWGAPYGSNQLVLTAGMQASITVPGSDFSVAYADQPGGGSFRVMVDGEETFVVPADVAFASAEGSCIWRIAGGFEGFPTACIGLKFGRWTAPCRSSVCLRMIPARIAQTNGGCGVKPALAILFHSTNVKKGVMPMNVDVRMDEENLKRIHEALFTRFYDERTYLIYDWADPDRDASLPRSDEVAAEIPNAAGWLTGFEDCCISGSAELMGLLSAHEKTGDALAAERVQKLWLGLRTLGTVSATPGFVCRGVLTADGKSHYPNSSADQYTLFASALYWFCKSPLATAEDRALIGRVATDICDFVLGADMNILCEDRRPGFVGGVGREREVGGKRTRFAGPGVLQYLALAASVTGERPFVRADAGLAGPDDVGRKRTHGRPSGQGSIHAGAIPRGKGHGGAIALHCGTDFPAGPTAGIMVTSGAAMRQTAIAAIMRVNAITSAT